MTISKQDIIKYWCTSAKKNLKVAQDLYNTKHSNKKTLLTGNPKFLAKKYYKALINAGIPVEKLIIFGSYAKGNYKYHSDLDICVVSPQFGKNRFNERLKLSTIARKIDDMIEPHPYHPKDLQEKWDPLAEQIRTTGKTL